MAHFSTRQPPYASLPSEEGFLEADDKDLDDHASASSTESQQHRLSPGGTPPHRLRQYLIHVFLIALALAITLAGSFKNRLLTDQICVGRLNAWSPLIDTNVIKYRWQNWEVSSPAETKYRGRPTLEREAAWDGLWRKQLALNGGISIPSSRVLAMNKTANVDRQMTPSGHYAGFLEVFHQIHCLATLRQYTYKDEYLAVIGKLPEPFQKPAVAQRVHLDHCIEVLRLSLLCSSDVGVTLAKVALGEASGFKPDFDGLHMCRDFDAIQTWVDEYTGV